MNSGYDFNGISEEMLGAYLEGTLQPNEAAMVSAEMDGNSALTQLAREVQNTEDNIDWEASPYDDDPFFDEDFALPDLDDFEVDEPMGYDEFAEVSNYYETSDDGMDDGMDVGAASDEPIGEDNDYAYAQENDYSFDDMGADTTTEDGFGSGFDSGFDTIDDGVF